MKKIELLAPAGNMESLIAAVSAGCDAVYLGLTTFSARAFAGNFTHEEYLEAIQYCHVREVKIYVTLNTLLFEMEFQNIIKEVEFLYENDVDALIIQDLGLFHYVTNRFPDLEVHCSTQMHIHNIDGARFMHKHGASRIVVARETLIEKIKEMCEEGLEIEAFSYGALCISYSGQCLMSSSVKNRSGNRGMCAQLCRLKYKTSKDKESYLLSPKDLNTLKYIPELIEAGISSLKIEGRMKRKEYVYLVTKLFRKAIDAYYEGKEFHISEQEQKDLLLMFNRGFTKGHIFHDSIEEHMSQDRPNHKGICIGTVLDYKDGQVLVRLTDTLYQHDGLRIINEPVDTGLTAVKILKNNKLVNVAYQGDEVWLDCKSKPYPKKGQPLHKTTDTLLLEKINQEINESKKNIPISLTYECIPKNPFKLNVTLSNHKVLTFETEALVQEAKSAPLTKERIQEQLSKVDEYPFMIASCEGNTSNAFLPIKEINNLRRIAFHKVYESLGKLHERKYLDAKYDYELNEKENPSQRIVIENLNTSKSNEDNYSFYPTIMEDGYPMKNLNNAVINEIGGLNLDLENCIAGMTLNCTNSYAATFLYAHKGINGIILSSELNHSQIDDLLKHFKELNHFDLPAYQLVYGRRTLMFIKDSFTNNKVDKIIDMHHNEFPVLQDKSLTRILEQEPYRLDNRSTYGSYIIFTSESDKIKQEVEQEAYEEIFNRI